MNGSLEFDAATLSPSYRFTKGIPGRSYGLAIARRLGLDARVLATAEGLVPDAERELDRLLANVEARRQALADREEDFAVRGADLERREAVAVQVAETQALRQGELARLEKEGERERARQAKAYLLAARKKVEEALALAQGAADAGAAREARRLIEDGVRDESRRLAEEETPEGSAAGGLAVGGRVRLTTGAVGELVEQRADGRAVVMVGAMRLIVTSQSLVPLGPSAPRARPVAQAVGGLVREAAWEIDLRGMRADEAEGMVLAAIDGATLAEQPHLAIIHGMGTGVLRDMVRRLLAADKRVASFDFAPRQQGGTGVTIAVFR